MKEFSIPEIDVWMDEGEYLRVMDLISTAASLAGDGEGQGRSENLEYDRGMVELIIRYMGWSQEHHEQVLDAIYNTARDNKG